VTELIVLPEHCDLAVRIGRLDVVGIDAAPRLRTTAASPLSRETPWDRFNSSAPEATNSCGTVFSLRKRRTARLPGVPNEPNIKWTLSRSTSPRVRSSATVGSELSSRDVKRILRR
jgi:hypothetical protein